MHELLQTCKNTVNKAVLGLNPKTLLFWSLVGLLVAHIASMLKEDKSWK